jgi:hypothetical protein
MVVQEQFCVGTKKQLTEFAMRVGTEHRPRKAGEASCSGAGAAWVVLSFQGKQVRHARVIAFLKCFSAQVKLLLSLLSKERKEALNQG